MVNWEYWLMPIIPVLRRFRQEDHKFEVNVGYESTGLVLAPAPETKYKPAVLGEMDQLMKRLSKP